MINTIRAAMADMRPLNIGIAVIAGATIGHFAVRQIVTPQPVPVVSAPAKLPPRPVRPGPNDVWRQAFEPIPIAERYFPLCQECRLDRRDMP